MWDLLFSLLERVFGWAKARREFRVEGEEYLDRNSLTYSDLLHRLIGLDHATLPGVNPINEGSVEQWVPVFKADPEAWRLVVFRRKVIAGYFSAFSLKDEAFAKLLDGKLADSELDASMLRSLSERGQHKLYVCTLISMHDFDTEHARVRDRITLALIQHLHELGKRGVLVEEVSAYAFSDDGERVCRQVGMTKIEQAQNRQGGQLFHAKVIPVAEALRNNRLTRKLALIYDAQLKRQPVST
ncbi:MAG: hypothetical protein IV086_11090 [Hyphomonadaceae bacterium]|nr:hypothetical protein [Hyphomonadaceae bacterium]